MLYDMYGETIAKVFALVAVAAGVIAVWIGVERKIIVLPWHDDTVGREVTDSGLGSIVLRPERYRQQLAKDRWIRSVRVGNHTLGQLLMQTSRFSVEGAGPIRGRRIYADTPAAARLLTGRSEARTERFLHGLQRLMHQRGAYVHGISFARTRDAYRANYLLGIVQSESLRPYFDYAARSDAERRQFLQELLPMALMSDGALATHRFESHWIDLDPNLTRHLEASLRAPRTVRPKDSLFVAHVIRHELEHSVSAYDGTFDDERVSTLHRWLEEGSADTLANWPGEAARTARMLGLPYPKKAEGMSWAAFNPGRGGYPEYVATMRILLTMAGVNVRDPRAFARADRILQRGDLDTTPRRLANAIIANDRATAKQRGWLIRQIEQLNGSPANARKLQRRLA